MADKPQTVREQRIPFSFLWTGSLRRRLWLGGVGVALFVVTLLIGNQFIAREKAVTADSIGLDFIAFYTAGTFVDQGRIGDLYDLDAKRAFQRGIADAISLEIGNAMGPWWNPPFYAWVFVPFSRFEFVTATLLWTGLNVVLVLIAIAMLAMLLKVEGCEKCDRLLLGLLVLVSMPFIGLVSHAQNTGMSLLLLTATVWAWRARRGLLAGLVCGLLFYKPQLAALVAGMLVLTLGARALLGLLCTGTALLAVTVTTLPGALSDFATRMPQNLALAQEKLVYIWDRHATTKAFWRLLIQGYEIGPASAVVNTLTIPCSGGLAVLLVVAAWRWRRQQDAATLDRLIAATIAAMPLIMPFYFDYDLLLLAIPAVLLAREALAGGIIPAWLRRVWAALYAWMYVNAPVAEATRVNVTVLLLAAVAGMMIARVHQPVRRTLAAADDARTPDVAPLAGAAAAG